MNTIDNTLSERLIQARKYKNISQKDLASLINVSPTRLNYWERAKCEPSVQHIKKICESLNISGDWLLGISNHRELLNTGEDSEQTHKINEITSRMLNMNEEELDRFYRVFKALLNN